MNIEEKIKINLLARGFDKDTQLNNRGLIGATIDETILEVVKNLTIPDVSDLLIAFYQHLEKNGENESCLTYKQEVGKFLAIYRR